MAGQFPQVKDPARFFRAPDEPAARTRATAGDPHNFLGSRMAQLAETDEDEQDDPALAAADAPDDVDQDDVADDFEEESDEAQLEDADEEETPQPREQRQAEPEEDEADEAQFDPRQTPEYQDLLRQRRQEAEQFRRQRSEQINRDMEQADRMKVARRGQLFQQLPNLDQQQVAQGIANELRLSDAEILHWKNVAYGALSHIDRTERLAALQERAGFTEAELQELTAVPDDQIEVHAERLIARRASQAASPDILRRLEKVERENKALKARSKGRHLVGGGTGARPRRPAPVEGSDAHLAQLLGFTNTRR